MCTPSHMHVYIIFSPVDLNSSQTGRAEAELSASSCCCCVHRLVYGPCGQPYMYDICMHIPAGNTSPASLLELQHSGLSQACRTIHFRISEVAGDNLDRTPTCLHLLPQCMLQMLLLKQRTIQIQEMDPHCCHQSISQGYRSHTHHNTLFSQQNPSSLKKECKSHRCFGLLLN